jgi:hypothetical protein
MTHLTQRQPPDYCKEGLFDSPESAAVDQELERKFSSFHEIDSLVHKQGKKLNSNVI